MTPAEFKSARKALGLSQTAMAQALGISDDRTVRRWEAGPQDVPGPVAVAVAYMLRDAGIDLKDFGTDIPLIFRMRAPKMLPGA